MKTPVNKFEKIESTLPIFNGFYCTPFEPNEEAEFGYWLEQYPTISDNHVIYDYEAYRNKASIGMCDVISDWLKELDITVKIEFNNVRSPRECNFTNDSIECTYTISKTARKKILSYLKKNGNRFSEYLTANFKSRSGFISLYEYDLASWLTTYQTENINVTFGYMLEFILLNEEKTIEDLYESVYYNGGADVPSQLQPEISQTILDIEETAKENYALDINIIALDLFKKYKNLEYSELYTVDFITTIVTRVYSEIDSQTLKLEL